MKYNNKIQDNILVLDQIQKDIEVGYKVIESGVNIKETAVLIVGNSGSGKTTLSQYITDKQKTEMSKLIIKNKSDNSIVPTKFAGEDDNLAFWDVPGFCNNNTFQDILSFLYVSKLLGQSEKVKIIALVSEDSFSGRAEDFIQFVNLFGKMLDNEVNYKNLIFVMSKSTTEDTKELVNFLQESILDKNLTQYPNFIKALINKAENDEVVFFKKDDENLEIKSKIFKLIEKVDYVQEIKYSVSSDTWYKISEIITTIDNDIKNIIKFNSEKSKDHDIGIKIKKKDELIQSKEELTKKNQAFSKA